MHALPMLVKRCCACRPAAPAPGRRAAAACVAAVAPGAGPAGGAPALTIPLKDVVEAAVERWFEDTLVEAQRGDTRAAALLAQMYAQGYGTARDASAAAKWAERARLRGYRMKGVYCEL
ncbi:MAG: hypothetical protein J3K34DRAFT_527153 [Monoraphidium minutum]|nr:MAG: hypothetical protein J3K34DRAFT_527153 [Monoraphidium minutum]